MPIHICHELGQRGKRPRTDIRGILPVSHFDALTNHVSMPKRQFSNRVAQKCRFSAVAFKQPHRTLGMCNGKDQAWQAATRPEIQPEAIRRSRKARELKRIGDVSGFELIHRARRDQIDSRIPLSEQSRERLKALCFT